jgi:protein-tyrosine phosphatase
MGIHADTGQAACGAITRLAAARGYDLSPHTATRFDPSLLRGNDHVLTFEPRHARILAETVIEVGIPVSLLGFWCRPIVPHIEDPFGLNIDYQTHCVQVIEDAVSRIASRVLALPED